MGNYLKKSESDTIERHYEMARGIILDELMEELYNGGADPARIRETAKLVKLHMEEIIITAHGAAVRDRPATEEDFK